MMLRDIMGNTPSSFRLKHTEYFRGNMIYCKTCDSPKLLNHEYFGWVRITCPCEIKADKEKAEEEQRLKQLESFRYLQKNSKLGARYKDVSFDNTELGEDTDKSFLVAFESCKRYCKNYLDVLAGGFGIYMYGGNGTGKSHLSACIINELSKKSMPTLFTNFYTLINDIKNHKANIKQIATIPFLVFDDIGSERVKFKDEDSWVQEIIFQIINQRYNERKPTIFTSNSTMEELMTKHGFSKRTIDRIIEMASKVLKLEGKSYRLKNRKKELPF